MLSKRGSRARATHKARVVSSSLQTAHVDADHADLDVRLELARRDPGASEQRGAVAVLVAIHQRDGLVQRLHLRRVRTDRCVQYVCETKMRTYVKYYTARLRVHIDFSEVDPGLSCAETQSALQWADAGSEKADCQAGDAMPAARATHGDVQICSVMVPQPACTHFQTDEDGAEDLLQPAVHGGRDAGDDGRPDEVAALVARDAHAAPVKQQLGALPNVATGFGQI